MWQSLSVLIDTAVSFMLSLFYFIPGFVLFFKYSGSPPLEVTQTRIFVGSLGNLFPLSHVGWRVGESDLHLLLHKPSEKWNELSGKGFQARSHLPYLVNVVCWSPAGNVVEITDYRVVCF